MGVVAAQTKAVVESKVAETRPPIASIPPALNFTRMDSRNFPARTRTTALLARDVRGTTGSDILSQFHAALEVPGGWPWAPMT